MRVLLVCLWMGSSVAAASTESSRGVTCADSHVQVGVSVLDQRANRGSWLRGSALARTWCGDTLQREQDLLIELVLADLCQMAELDGAACDALEALSRGEVQRALAEPRLVSLSLSRDQPGGDVGGEIGLAFADDTRQRLNGEVWTDGRFQSRTLSFSTHADQEGDLLDCTVSRKVAATGTLHPAARSKVELSRTRTLLCRSPSGDRFLKLEVEHQEQAASDADGVVVRPDVDGDIED